MIRTFNHIREKETRNFIRTWYVILRHNASRKKYRRSPKWANINHSWTQWWISHGFRLYEPFQKKPCAYEFDEAPWFIPNSKNSRTTIAYKLEQNDLPEPYFCPYSRQFVEFVKKKKKLSQIPKGLSNSVVNWSQNFTFIANKKKTSVRYHLQPACCEEPTYPSRSNTYLGAEGIWNL